MAKQKSAKKKSTAKKSAAKTAKPTVAKQTSASGKVAKPTAKKKKVAKQKAAKRRTAAAKAATKTKRTAAKQAKKTSAQKAVKKKITKKSGKSLGRPRVTGAAKLDHFFIRDYEARQVFDFLRLTTVKELESFGPDEIVERLTAPVVQTVNRIRKALAMNNRCLNGDKRFAREFQQALKKLK